MPTVMHQIDRKKEINKSEVQDIWVELIVIPWEIVSK